MKKLVVSFFIIVFFLHNPLFGQEEKSFETSDAYLGYLEKKFKIEPSDVYYLSTESDSLSGKFEKFGIVLLVTKNQVATIYEVADEMGIQCSPNKLMPKVTNDAIINASDESEYLENIILKSLDDGNVIKFGQEKIAIYMFSYKFGKKGKLFLKEKEHLEALGYKTVVLSIDGAYLKDVPDIDKTPVYVQ